MKNPDDKIYVQHIIDCIERIQEYIPEGLDTLLSDNKTYDAVIRQLQGTVKKFV